MQPKFSLIGNGYIGKRHQQSIKEIGGELLMVSDTRKSREVEGLPFCLDYQNFRKNTHWKDVTHVVVATPNHLHLKHAMWAVGQSKIVLCEKPLSFDIPTVTRYQGMESVFNVMQLRKHPVFGELMALDKDMILEIELYVKVKRNKAYWKGWKGDRNKSGGILFNLGVHYFDVLNQMFGLYNYHKSEIDIQTDRLVQGRIYFFGLAPPVKFKVMIGETDEGVDRFIKINDKEYRFSNQENLSMEGLHTKVYEDMIEGKGVKNRDVIDTLRLIHVIEKNG